MKNFAKVALSKECYFLRKVYESGAFSLPNSPYYVFPIAYNQGRIQEFLIEWGGGGVQT